MKTVELLPIVEQSLKSQGIAYQAVACDPELADTAAFCERYGYSLEQSANTILVVTKEPNPRYAVCVVLAATRLDVNKKVRELLNARKVSFASPEQTIEQSGMIIGGVTAFGFQSTPVFIDAEVLNQPQVIMGGGNRTSKLVLNPQELKKLEGVEIVVGLAKPRD